MRFVGESEEMASRAREACVCVRSLLEASSEQRVPIAPAEAMDTLEDGRCG